MLTVSHVSELVAIMRSVKSMSKSWPYMLNYVAVRVPPGLVRGYESPHLNLSNEPWSRGTLIAWCSMRALTSILIQMTHIQFLTILYPSIFVSRLIVGVLSPLALISACTQYLPLSATSLASTDPGPYKALVANLAIPALPYLPLSTLALVTRQTLTTTLSLLFTILFLFWGTYLHPRRAWRAEGGTAAFGIGAVGLAALGTSLGFVCLPGVSLEGPNAGMNESPCSWLPGLVWVVILWQSYLAWWWWVGSGVGMDRKRRRRHVKEDRELEDSEGEVLWQTTAIDGGGGGARRRTPGPEQNAFQQKESARKRGWLTPYIPFNKPLWRRQPQRTQL
ncbi:hypothetical protein EWM64_g8059 [Hericium alpestre]|uniref:Uncharacterized protein n=1 Tax=Hericium alpestre TaxID=135208 RepID=A0A4Y9ZMW2_9AGAM|nr:hypothetical protein EWM64_g8059 [Hericium alpestre]